MIRLSSFKRSKRSLLALGAGALAISLVGIVPAMAAEADPTLKLSLLDDDIVIVSARYFAASTDVTLTATVDGGSGTSTIETNASGRAILGFELPDGYDGKVTVKAVSGDLEKTASIDVDSDAPTPAAPTTAAPTATAPSSVAPSTTTPPATTTPATPAPAGGNGDWLSGVAMDQTQVEGFANWRGSPVEIISTFADKGENQRQLWTLDVTVQNWNGPIDLAVGGIDDGETWAAAATGAYEERWRESLTKMKSKRAGKGTTYIRFAHEMNGSWYPWKVTAGDSESFKAAWIRYRAIQKEIFPEAKLVFNVNRESAGAGINWTKTFPGAQYVDVMGVDYYNAWPEAKTAAEFKEQLTQTDGYGSPKGLAAHLAFAKSVGLPLSISEWSNAADKADSPEFVKGMHEFISANAGTGAGQIIYECQFNVADGYNGVFDFWPATKAPNAANAYRDLF